MMASRGSESDPGDATRLFPFASPFTEGLRGASSLFTLATELWCPLCSEVTDGEDRAEWCDR